MHEPALNLAILQMTRGKTLASGTVVHVTTRVVACTTLSPSRYAHLKGDKVPICDQAESTAAVQSCASGADGKCHTTCLHAQQGHHPVPERSMPQTLGSSP